MASELTESFPELRLQAQDLVGEALARYRPSKVFALYSGGNDSGVLADVALRELGDRLDGLFHIDTGTALPGVREHVEDFARGLGVPLFVYSAGDEYERMVAEHGMPGPGVHHIAYVRLKERRIDALISDHKQRWNDRIVLLSGVRRAESRRRMGRAVPVKREGCQVWVNPLIDWSNEQMREWRTVRRLPQSDVAALIHRSGECNCGAMAHEGEREELRSLWPGWFERNIARRECVARRLGHRWCRWGEPRPNASRDSAGLLCMDCAPTLFDASRTQATGDDDA